MSQGSLIVACDFGTTAFRALVTEIGADGSLEILGCSQEPTEGFQDGDFVNLAAGTRCIARTMRALEADCDIYVTGFTYSAAGSHLRSVRSTAQLPIGPGPRPIRAGDVEDVRGRVRSMALPFDHRILTVTPVEFAVDRVRGIVDPVGRVGSQLEMQAHLVTGSRSVLHNLQNAIETAKYRPQGEEVDVLAAGESLLTGPEREAGVILVDMGGQCTNWAVYRQGAVLSCGTVPLGGDHLTGDLAHGLRISVSEAERVKQLRGVVLRSLVDAVSIDALFEEERPAETPGLVAAILEPRCEEILSYVKRDFGDLRELSRLQAGVVITGGGSRCEGTRQLCEEVFDLPVQARYLPAGLGGSDRLPPGQWATVIGLSMCVARDAVDAETVEQSARDGNLLGRLRKVFRPRERAATGAG
ncbi:cell division protein FtsA [bacterium]|nr:MAG: cell division protein FtsA [bacterium]